MEEKIYIQDLDLKKCPINKKEGNTTITIIDGDGFGFIVGWHFAKYFTITPELVSELNGKVDNFLNTILGEMNTDYLLGILEAEVDYNIPDEEYMPIINFRHKYATSKGYKAKRPSKPDWYKLWGPLVQKRLVEKWGFQRVPPEVEADDMVASLSSKLRAYDNLNIITCGNDKDLHQIPGVFYDYKKNESWFIEEVDAVRSLYKQVLMGDTTDNIPGLKGYGKAKAEAIVNNPKFNEKSAYMYTLREFVVKLGEDAGIQSFFENYMLCKLRTDLQCSQYSLTKFDFQESDTMIKMRELLGDQEVNDIIVENSLDNSDFSGSDMFNI